MPRRPYLSGASDTVAVIPDHLRCNRTDGRRWRCPLPSLPNLRLCSHHYRPAAAAAKSLPRQTLPPLRHRRRHSSRAKPLDQDHPRRRRTDARSSAVKTLPDHRRRSSTDAGKPLPDDLRCKRTDGRGWRCHRHRQLDVNFCDHHYKLYQKNNSKTKPSDSLTLLDDLVLSSIKKRRRKRRREEMEELVRVAVRRRLEVREERERRRRRRKEEAVTVQLPNGIMAIALPSAAEVGCFRNVGPKIDRKVGFDGGSFFRRCFRSKNVEPAPVVSKKRLPYRRGLGKRVKRICHGCQQKVVAMIRCTKCKTFFCSGCIKSRYFAMSELEVKNSCPICRARCSCKACMPVKHEIDHYEEPVTSHLRYTDYVVHELLPAIEQINGVQRTELEIEANNQGKSFSDVHLQAAECKCDELLKCSFCETSINGFHRCCPKCSFKICTSCCQEVRGQSKRGQPAEVDSGNSKRIKVCMQLGDVFGGTKRGLRTKFSSPRLSSYSSKLLKKQKLRKDTRSLFCPAKILGGCGEGILNLEIVLPFGSIGPSRKRR